MRKIFGLVLLFSTLVSGAQKNGPAKHGSPVKKTVPPASANAGGPEASIISFTIQHGGDKIGINNKQFETWGGTTLPNGTGPALILNYGASNSKKNEESFNWMFTIPKAEKGTYTVGDREGDGPATSLQFMTSAFPNIPMFLCKSGTITIEACPLPGGFVKGTFNVVLTGGVTSDGQLDESLYTVSGSFSILRQ